MPYKLVKILSTREPKHSGYCSDPGSDIGEEIDTLEEQNLSKSEYEDVQTYVKHFRKKKKLA